ncbi:MAG: hypothetical protein J6X94_02930 [Lachnospiraceae bacterium]|nr:hypothetical protein [Lachnospiraceae bacterium]
MATLREDTLEQLKEMKDRPFKEKLEYFWEYYKFLALGVIATIAILIAIIHTIVSYRSYAIAILIVNSDTLVSDEISPEWESDLSEILQINTKKEQIYIDTSIQCGNNTQQQLEYAALQKLVAFFTSQTADVFVANTPLFEEYSQNGNISDLRNYYSEEELEALSDIIYYTDAATFADYQDMANLNAQEDQEQYIVDHRDPDSMEDPIPTGFFITDSSRLGRAGVYGYLSGFDDYQGHPQEGVIGIPIVVTDVEKAKATVEYFLG